MKGSVDSSTPRNKNLNIESKLTTIIEDERNQQSLEVILEAHKTINMIDIADVNFPREERVRKLISKYDDAFNLSGNSEMLSMVSFISSSLPPNPEGRFNDFNVKNKTRVERRSQC